jgi:hypothetical protein
MRLNERIIERMARTALRELREELGEEPTVDAFQDALDNYDFDGVKFDYVRKGGGERAPGWEIRQAVERIGVRLIEAAESAEEQRERERDQADADRVNNMTGTQYKSYETRLRRMAQRQELVLRKSRTRDPRAADYNGYWLIDLRGNYLVWPPDGGNCGASLPEIERYLIEEG